MYTAVCVQTDTQSLLEIGCGGNPVHHPDFHDDGFTEVITMCRIVHVGNHYEVLSDLGEFVASADTLSEAEDEVDDFRKEFAKSIKTA